MSSAQIWCRLGFWMVVLKFYPEPIFQEHWYTYLKPLSLVTHERTTTAKNMGILKYHQTSLISYERCWLGRSYQTKPGLPSGCQVNIKCFYAKSTCLGSNHRNISSLTLVQKVIPGYLQRTVHNYSWAYLWLISHDLSHGVPLMPCAGDPGTELKGRNDCNSVWPKKSNNCYSREWSFALFLHEHG
jgi:hypothetical protein